MGVTGQGRNCPSWTHFTIQCSRFTLKKKLQSGVGIGRTLDQEELAWRRFPGSAVWDQLLRTDGEGRGGGGWPAEWGGESTRAGEEALTHGHGEVVRRNGAFLPVESLRYLSGNPSCGLTSWKILPHARKRRKAVSLDTICWASPGTCRLPNSERSESCEQFGSCVF